MYGYHLSIVYKDGINAVPTIKHIFLCILFIYIVCYLTAFELKTINITAPFPEKIDFTDKYIDMQSIKVYADSLLLVNEVDYVVNDGIIVLQTDKYENITIEYIAFPESLFQAFRLYEPFEMTDSTKVEAMNTNWDRIFSEQSKLNITGSKTVSISVSNTNNFDLNQSLYLRIDGELSSNVFLKAQLSDNESPISPEGSTRELSSLDEVFLSVYGKEYEVSFGDLQFDIAGTKFINYSQKYEGLKVRYDDIDGRHIWRPYATVGVALSNSKSAYITFAGVEGKQGPYFLKPNGVYGTVTVIEGSETLWLNGRQLDRGKDYTIEYNEGFIDFALSHFISANSHVQASFQYTDEYYRKNALFGSSSVNITDRFKVSASAIYQNDDKENPLSDSFSDSDKEALAGSSGVTPIYANGATNVGNGEGRYRWVSDRRDGIYAVRTNSDGMNAVPTKTDTINGVPTKTDGINAVPTDGGHFEYAPGAEDADYDVVFSYIGEGQGDYRQVSVYIFEYVGVGQGAWMPEREIIAPERKANYDFSLAYEDDIFEFSTESLISEYDKNTFSEVGDEHKYSQIHQIQMSFHPDYDLINPELTAWYRYRQRDLYTFATILNENETYQQYAFTSVDTLDSQEYNIALKTLSFDLLTQETQVKRIDFESKVRQTYINAFQSVKQSKYLPYLDYRFHYSETDAINGIPTENMEKVREKQKLLIHEPTTKYTLGNFGWTGTAQFYRRDTIYGVRIPLTEDRRDTIYGVRIPLTEDSRDTIYGVRIPSQTGSRYTKYFTEGTLAKFLKSTLSASYLYDENIGFTDTMNGVPTMADAASGVPTWLKERNSQTVSVQTETRFEKHQVTALYSHRVVKHFTGDDGEQTFDIAEISTKNELFNEGILLNGSYNLKNTEFFPRFRELVYVGEGAGVCDSLGVFTENGDYEYEYALSDNAQRSIEVSAKATAYTYPAQFYIPKGAVKDFLVKVNLETDIAITEHTENPDRWKVYLLSPSAIMSDKSIYSRQEHRETVWYNIVPNKWISRYTFLETKTRDRRYVGTALMPSGNVGTAYMPSVVSESEIALRLLRWGVSDYEATYKWRSEYDNLYDLDTQGRKVGLNIRTAPSRQLIFTTDFGFERETNTQRDISQEIDRYSFGENVMYFIGQKYRLNVLFNMKHNKVSDTLLANLPTDKVAGWFYNWQSGMEYRINKISTLNVGYTGYKNPSEKEAYHLVKMEVRAEF